MSSSPQLHNNRIATPTPLSNLPFASGAFKYLFAETSLVPSTPKTFTVFKPAIYRHFALKTQQSVEEHASEDLHDFMAVYYKTLIARPLYKNLKMCLQNRAQWESSTDEVYRITHKIQEMWHKRRNGAGKNQGDLPHSTVARVVNDRKVMNTPCLVDFIDYRGATMETISDESIANYTSLKECLQETLIERTSNVVTSPNSLTFTAEDSTLGWVTKDCADHIERFTSQDSIAHKNKVDLLSSIIDKMEPLHTTSVCKSLLEEKYNAYIHHGVQSGEFTETSNKYFACEMQQQNAKQWATYEECYKKNEDAIKKQKNEENIEYCKQEIFDVLDAYIQKEEQRIHEYKTALRQEEGRLF